MNLAIVIETKDRRLNGGVNYLGDTIRNLRRSSYEINGEGINVVGIDIVCNGVVEAHTPAQSFEYTEIWVPFERWAGDKRVNYHYEPGTRQQNAARAIRRGAAHADADWVLKLEDDLDFCADFLGSVSRWLAKYGHAKVPMFALGATFASVSGSKFQPGETILEPGPSFTYVREAMRRGQEILAHPALGFWGAQALLWRRQVAEDLAEWLGDDPALFDGKEYHRERGHDLLLQQWAGDRGDRAFAVACPAFVQHVGRQSNLSDPKIGHVQPFFEFPWPGREWSFR